jgi:hypothetical protein
MIGCAMLEPAYSTFRNQRYCKRFMSESTGGSEWSESATALEVRGMIEDWEKEGTRGTSLLYALQAMITEEFFGTISPRLCRLLRQFLARMCRLMSGRPAHTITLS